VDANDPFLTAGFNALSTATGGIAQFWDRDADAEYAKAGMEGFQQFLVQPDQLQAILDRLEQTRLRIYRSDLTKGRPLSQGTPVFLSWGRHGSGISTGGATLDAAQPSRPGFSSPPGCSCSRSMCSGRSSKA
jgi:hypothetical protein